MAATNNVERLLRSRRIDYAVFELPPKKLGAKQTAALLGVPPKIVFKTIVVLREKPGKPLLVVVPAPSEVDLKLVAAVLGIKKVQLPTEHEAERLTGLLAGGISPLALIHRGFDVILDESALEFAAIHISGGQRGLNISLSPADLVSLTHARMYRVTQPSGDQPSS